MDNFIPTQGTILYKNQDFKKAWERQSLMLLDNIGIYVKQNELRSFELYRYFQRKRYGTNLLSKTWCKYFRKYIRPNKNNKIIELYTMIKVIYEEENMRTILSQAKEKGYINIK